MDPWWNPAVEQQAQDRIHRIGQYKPIRWVLCVLHCPDSIKTQVTGLLSLRALTVSSVFVGL